MTRQVTTYVPSDELRQRDRDLALVPSGCSGEPVTTRSRSLVYTRMPPSDTSTGSLKRSVTSVGGLS